MNGGIRYKIDSAIINGNTGHLKRDSWEQQLVCVSYSDLQFEVQLMQKIWIKRTIPHLYTQLSDYLSNQDLHSIKHCDD